MKRDQAEYVRQNWGVLTTGQIAHHLGLKESEIERYVEQHSLNQPNNESAKILGDLRAEPFYTELARQFQPRERTTFESQWVSIVREWGGDILEREKPELREFLSYEILKSRTMSEEKRLLNRQTTMERELNDMERRDRDTLVKEEKHEIQRLRNELTNVAKAITESRATYKSLCEKADKTRRSLFESRAQRTRALEAAGSDFTSLLKQLDDWQFRQDAAREMELLRKAAEAERDRLTEIYEFADGTLDPPILNEDTYFEHES